MKLTVVYMLVQEGFPDVHADNITARFAAKMATTLPSVT
jgi:hypothetical protein